MSATRNQKSRGAADRPSIVVVDEDLRDRRLALKILAPLGERFRLCKAADAAEWMEILNGQTPAAVICAHTLSWGDGRSVLRMARLYHPTCITVLLGAQDALEVQAALASGDADEALAKNTLGWTALLNRVTRLVASRTAASDARQTDADSSPILTSFERDTPDEQAEPPAPPPLATSASTETEQPRWLASTDALSHDMRDWVQLIAHRVTALSERRSVQSDPGAVHDLSRILSNVERLQSVLDRMFTSSRDVAEFEAVPLDAIIGEIADQLCLAVPDTKVDLDSANLPVVEGERTSLYRLFDNLIRNAIRHTDKAVVHIRIRAAKVPGAHLLSVTDNGPGIPADMLQKVFEPYARATLDASKPGRGIGLANCRDIVEAHGGSIWIESPPGRGITVFIRLPFRASSIRGTIDP